MSTAYLYLVTVCLCILFAKARADVAVWTAFPTTVGIGGGTSFTVTGTNFPVNEAFRIVFLESPYQLIPKETCEVDVARSSSTFAVCNQLPPFSVAAADNVTNSDMSNGLTVKRYVGVQSSAPSRFFPSVPTPISVVTPQVMLVGIAPVIQPAVAFPVRLASIGSSISRSDLLRLPSALSLALFDAALPTTQRATCSPISITEFTTEQVAKLTNSFEIPFLCPFVGSDLLTPQLYVLGERAIMTSQVKVQISSLSGDASVVYQTRIAPQIDSVSPSSVASGVPVTITIAGSGISRSVSENVVKVGGSDCSVLSSSLDVITCRGTFPASAAITASEAGSNGFLARYFTLSGTTLADLVSSTPSGALLTNDATAPQLTRITTSNLRFEQFATPSGVTLPYAAVFEGFFTPPVAGTYRFYCAASSVAKLDLFVNGAWVRMCSSSGAASLLLPQAIYGNSGAVSAATTLTSAAVPLRAAVSVSDTAASARFATSFSLSDSTHLSTLPLMLRLVANIEAANRTVHALSFTIDGRSYQVPQSSINAVDCSHVKMVNILSNFAVEESVVYSNTACTWFLVIRSTATGANLTFNLTSSSDTTSATVITAASPSTGFVADFPSLWSRIPYTASANQVLVDMTVRGSRATTVGTQPQLLSIAETAGPECTLGSSSAVQLRSSGLTLTISTVGSASFPVAAVKSQFLIDLVPYSLLISSVEGLTSTAYNDTSLNVTIPATLASGVYRVVLDMGKYGRRECGDVVQGFQAVLVRPSEGPQFGGTVITVSGTNFPRMTKGYDQYISITVEAARCSVFYTTATALYCRTSPMAVYSNSVPIDSDATSVTYNIKVTILQDSLPSALSTYQNFSHLDGRGFPSFKYYTSGDLMPVITSVAPTTGAASSRTNFTIEGRNLASVSYIICNASQSYFSRASCVQCLVRSVSSTRGECMAPRLPPGQYAIIAQNGIGVGFSNTNMTYTSVFTVNSIKPASTSPDGGGVITIVGDGFSTDVTIRLGSIGCVPSEVNRTVIVCKLNTGTLPSGAVAPTISSSQGGLTFFAAIANLTTGRISTASTAGSPMPVVPYITPGSGNGVGTTITIMSTNFPSELTVNDVTVMLGSAPCAVFALDNSEVLNSVLTNKVEKVALIYCRRTVSVPAGTDPVLVTFGTYGTVTAGTANREQPFVRSTYTHTLTIDEVTPLNGSTAGGTLVTLTGNGFGGSDFEILMGTVPCRSSASIANTSITQTMVKCRLDSSANTAINASVFITARSRDISSVFREKFFLTTASAALLTKATPLTGNAGTVVTITLQETNINATTVRLAGRYVPLTYQGAGSFSFTLPNLPALRSALIAQTAFGDTRSATSVVFVSYPSITSITPQQAPVGGGSYVTITGDRFGADATANNLKVLICGNDCTIVSSSQTSIVCVTPPLYNLATLSSSAISRAAQRISATPFSSGGTVLTALSNLVDGDVTTSGSLSGTGLSIGLDVGDYRSAHILEVHFYPTPGTESGLVGGALYSSSDKVTWTKIAVISAVLPGNNTIQFKTGTVFAQYIQLTAPSTSTMLSLAEFSLFGVRGGATAVNFCPLIVTLQAPGSDSMSTCLQQPLLCTNVDPSIRITYSLSYTISGFDPSLVSPRGATLSFVGSFPSVSTTDITAVAAGLPCTVVSASTTQISCKTAEVPSDTVAGRAMSLSFAQVGNALMTTTTLFHIGLRWSQTVAWAGASVPQSGDLVIIPEGVTILLDVATPALAGIIVYGTLRVAEDSPSVTISAEFILVETTGLLLAGDANTPFAGLLDINLLPPQYSASHPVFGSTFLAVNGGALSLAGQATSSVFVTLARPALVGATSITVSGVATWSVGSTIAIPSSSTTMDETEVRKITAYRLDGANTVFDINLPLLYLHRQGVETNDLGLSATYSASPAVLTRRVVVRSFDPLRRGHVLIRSSPTTGRPPSVVLFHVQFSQLGQRTSTLRFPLALVGIHRPSSVTITGVVVSDSWNRGIYLEDTQYVTMTSVVVHDVIGHGISMDSAGLSRFNTISGSMVLSTKQGILDARPAGFRITHPTNSLLNNIMVGSDGDGILLEFGPSPAPGVCPQEEEFVTFTRNYVQACVVGLHLPRMHTARVVPCGDRSPMINTVKPTVLSTLSFYANQQHVLIRNAAGWTITGSWFIGATDTAISVEEVWNGYLTIAKSDIVAHMSFQTTPFGVLNAAKGFTGVSLPSESGGVVLNDVRFDKYSAGPIPHSAIVSCRYCKTPLSSRLVGYVNYVKAVSFANTDTRYLAFPPFTNVLIDLDGGFTNGGVNASLIPSAPHFAALPGCTTADNTMYKTDANAATLLFCGSGYSFHLVRLTANFGGNGVTVKSDAGSTDYQSQVSSLDPTLEDVMVVIPSGTYGGNNLTAAWNVSVLHHNSVDWSRIIVRVPYNVPIQGKQLGIQFHFRNQTTFLSAFPRTFNYSVSLSNPPLSVGDSLVSSLPTYEGVAGSQPSYLLQYPSNITLSLYSNYAPDTQHALAYDLRTGTCPSGQVCLSQADPDNGSRDYPWSDVRSWPRTNRVPRNDDDAVIPRGVTVTLNVVSAKLRSLIVEGTLIFHNRLSTELNAKFIIINGGSIVAGSVSSPQTSQSIINLIHDPSTAPFVVSKSLQIPSGTLLNMGTLQLAGSPKTVPWTSLGALLAAGTPTVTTADVLDWSSEELVAVSSSNYDNANTEMLRIGALSADRRGFTARTSTKMQHDWYSMTVTDNTKMTASAKVAVLNRTVTIRGVGTRVGCQIYFRGSSDTTVSAKGYLNNVAIENCGFDSDSSSSSLLGSAVVLSNVRTDAVSIKEVALFNSVGGGIAVFGSSATVTVERSVIIGTAGSSIYFDGDSSGNLVTETLVFNTGFSREILAHPERPLALCSFDSRHSLNTFQRSVAAGSDSEGFCVVLPACSATTTFSENEAHSNVVGLFVSPVATETCVQVDNFHAWHNTHVGLYSGLAADTKVISSQLHDNHIQVVLGRVGSGTNLLSNTIIGGRSGYFDGIPCSATMCMTNRLTKTCLERSNLVPSDPGVSFVNGEIGIYVIPFIMKDPPTAEYPRTATAEPFFHLKATSTTPTYATLEVTNCVFYYWYRGNDYGRCSGSSAVATMGMATTTLPVVMLSGTVWATMNNDARLYFHSPVAKWADYPDMCDGFVCDALNHALLNDVDGAFFAKSYSVSATSNYAPAAIGCEYTTVWNTYTCTRPMGLLTLRSYNLPYDNDVVFEPMQIRESQFEDKPNNNIMQPKCATTNISDDCKQRNRDLFFASPVKLSTRYEVSFNVESPKRLRFTVDRCPGSSASTGRIMVLLQLPPHSRFSAWVYNDRDDVLKGVRVDPVENLIFADSPVGSNFFDSQKDQVRLILQCGYHVEVHTLVQATAVMLLATDVETFSYDLQESFLASLASFLIVDRKRISIESVVPGSTVTQLQLLGVDDSNFNPTTAAAEINELLLTLIGSPPVNMTQNLGFPVLQTIAAVWASEYSSTVGPPGIHFQLTTGLIVAIAVVGFVVLLIIVFAQWRVYKAIVNYTDETEEAEDGDEDEEYEMGEEPPPITLDAAGDNQNDNNKFVVQVTQDHE